MDGSHNKDRKKKIVGIDISVEDINKEAPYKYKRQVIISSKWL